MYLTTGEMIIEKMKKLGEALIGSIALVSPLFMLLFCWCEPELAKTVLGIAFGVGLVAFVVYKIVDQIRFTLREKRLRAEKRAAKLAHADKVLAAARATRLATAPVYKPVLFDYEEHQ